MLDTFSGINYGGGAFTPPVRTRAVFRQPTAGAANANFAANIERGTVCVFDFYQRGIFNGRSAVGGAPNYTVENQTAPPTGPDGILSNVTVLDSTSTPAAATRCGIAVLDQDTLNVGEEGQFVVSGGPVRARVSGAVNRGNRLAIDVSADTKANAGRFKVAAANEIVYAVAGETIGAAGLIWVWLCKPHQATTAGNA